MERTTCSLTIHYREQDYHPKCSFSYKSEFKFHLGFKYFCKPSLQTLPVFQTSTIRHDTQKYAIAENFIQQRNEGR